MVVWGLTPDVFWRLHPLEFWWMLDARRPRKAYGDLNEEEVAEMYDLLAQEGAFDD